MKSQEVLHVDRPLQIIPTCLKPTLLQVHFFRETNKMVAIRTFWVDESLPVLPTHPREAIPDEVMMAGNRKLLT
jgi:hypothetical protein